MIQIVHEYIVNDLRWIKKHSFDDLHVVVFFMLYFISKKTNSLIIKDMWRIKGNFIW